MRLDRLSLAGSDHVPMERRDARLGHLGRHRLLLGRFDQLSLLRFVHLLGRRVRLLFMGRFDDLSLMGLDHLSLAGFDNLSLLLEHGVRCGGELVPRRHREPLCQKVANNFVEFDGNWIVREVEKQSLGPDLPQRFGEVGDAGRFDE